MSSVFEFPLRPPEKGTHSKKHKAKEEEDISVQQATSHFFLQPDPLVSLPEFPDIVAFWVWTILLVSLKKNFFGLPIHLIAGGSLATFGGKLIDPLVVKGSFFRGSPIFPPKVAKRPAHLSGLSHFSGDHFGGNLANVFPFLVACSEVRVVSRPAEDFHIYNEIARLPPLRQPPSAGPQDRWDLCARIPGPEPKMGGWSVCRGNPPPKWFRCGLPLKPPPQMVC